MLIIKDLVILNLPKTGSSFVRKVIKDIFLKRRNKTLTGRILNKLRIKSIGYKEIMTDHPIVSNKRDQHGCFDQIPEKDKHKEILSVVRDPYLRLESLYKHRFWARYPPVGKKQLETLFPTFPDLSIQEYLKLQMVGNDQMKEKYGIDKNVKIGNQSIQFIRFFFRDHKQVLSEMDHDYIKNGEFKKDMISVTLLKNENLNSELASFLSKNSFSKEEVNFVLSHEKVNVAKDDMEKSLIDQDLIHFVNENEWILLEILSSLGINYKREL